MGLSMSGCQGKDNLQVEERICPVCGEEVEIFSIDTQAECPSCGHIVYNDMITCVQWCQYAEQCVGPENYKRFMEVAKAQEERKKAEEEQEA